MRWLGFAGFALLTACGASQVQSQKLKDGSWSFHCELSMDECIRRVQDQCKNQRFRILEGTSETRLRDAPPFERAYHTSRLHLVCTDDGANVLLSVSGGAGAPASPGSKVNATCTTGQTRACVGPGACQGGQACLPDGSGYGACDCGPAAAAPPAPAAAAPPADAATDAPPPAATAPSAPAAPAPSSNPAIP